MHKIASSGSSREAGSRVLVALSPNENRRQKKSSSLWDEDARVLEASYFRFRDLYTRAAKPLARSMKLAGSGTDGPPPL